MDTAHKKQVDPKKMTLFCYRNIEDVKQEEKDVPDMLESIMRSTCVVKEELRRILMRMGQFRAKITKIRASTFWIPEI